MKKTLTFFLFFIMISGFLIFILPYETVKATSTFSTVIENFDTYGEGVHSGNNGYLNWSGSLATTYSPVKYSSPLALYLGTQPSVNPIFCYFNLSTPITINSFNYKSNFTKSTSADEYTYISLINSSGKEFIRYKIRYSAPHIYFSVWDYDNWYDIATLDPCWYHFLTIGFQGNHTSTNPLNYVYYYIKDEVTGNYIANVEKRWNSTSVFTVQNLSKIIFENHNTGIATEVISVIDDLTAGYGNFIGSSGFSYDEGYIIRCMNSGSTACTDTYELLSDCWTDWGCVALHFLDGPGIVAQCSECPITYNPTRYIEYKTQYQYNDIIHDVFLPIGIGQYKYVSSTPSDYSMTINGVDCGVADYIIPYGSEYAIVWKNADKKISNDYVLFSFKSDKTTVGHGRNAYWLELFYTFGGGGTTKTHNDLTAYLNNQLDGQDWGNLELYLCWSFNQSTIVDPYTPNVAEIIVLDYYDDYFGTGDNDTGYMEFYNFEQLCGYNTGQSPVILFNLTGYNTSKIKYYAYQIYQQQGTTNLFVDNGIIEVTGKYRKGIIHSTFKFPNSGKYYIMVYNETSDGMTLNNFIHRSESVGVCDTVTQPVTKTTEIEYNWIFALCIIMGFIIAPVILFRNNQFFINNGSIIVALFGIIGLGICINSGLVELWFAFLIALICVGIMALKIYQLMNGENDNE